MISALFAVVAAMPPGQAQQTIARLADRSEHLTQLPSPEEQGVPLDLEVVLISVARAHPDVLGSMADARGAEGKLVSARGAFDPTLAVDGTTVPEGYYDYSFIGAQLRQATPLWGLDITAGYQIGRPGLNTFPPYDEFLETLDGGEIGVGVGLPLWRGGPIDPERAKIRQGRAGVEEFRAQIRGTRLSIALQAVDAYWGWRAAAEKYRVFYDLVQIARQRDGAVRSSIEQGTLPTVERAESLRAIFERTNQAWSSWQKLQNAAVKLSLFSRDISGAPIVPPASAAALLGPPGGWAPANASDIDPAISKRPEIAVLQQKLEKADIEVKLRRNRVAPKLDFKAALSKDLGTTGDPERVEELDPTELKLGLVLEAPLLFRKDRGMLTEAEAARDALANKAQLVGEKLRASLLQLSQQIEALERKAEVAVELRDAAELAAEAERRRFAIGTSDLFKVFQRESKSAEASLKAIDAIAARHAADEVWGLATCAEPVAPDLDPC